MIKYLKYLGRLHKSDECFKTFKNARKAGFDNINTDMIFNIPEFIDTKLGQKI